MLPFYEYHTKLFSCGTSHKYFNFPPHLHESPEFVRVLEGVLEIQIHTTVYRVKAGELAIIMPNVVHSYKTPEQEDTKFNILITNLKFNNEIPAGMKKGHITNPVNPIASFHRDVNYIFSIFADEAQSLKNEQLIRSYLNIFYTRLFPGLTIDPNGLPPVSDSINDLVVYISKHFCEPLSLDLLSKELGICKYQISRIFTKVLGTSFNEYINTSRIHYAQRLLVNSNDKIIDIAMKCGFQSQQTFNRVFRQQCEITPAEFRKQYKV